MTDKLLHAPMNGMERVGALEDGAGCDGSPQEDVSHEWNGASRMYVYLSGKWMETKKFGQQYSDRPYKNWHNHYALMSWSI